MHDRVRLGKNFKIVGKQWHSDHTFSLWLEARHIAEAFRPGQFVMVRIDKMGERIPLTVAAVDDSRSRIRLVVQAVGFTTRHLSRLTESDHLLDVVGPLGKPIEVRKYPGPILGVAGGVGAAPLLPQLKAYRHAGNRIMTILGARNARQLLLVDELREVSDKLYLTTDDGSFERKGLVTEVMAEVIDSGVKPSLIVAIGPPIMMKLTCELAVSRGFPVTASLNPVMVDGTGMCGGCRVTVGDETYFACVDGPDFDGSKVNWGELMARLGTYNSQEKYLADHHCRVGGGRVAI